MKKIYYIIIFASIGSLFFAILMQKFTLMNFLLGFFIGGIGSVIIINGMNISLTPKKQAAYLKFYLKLIASIYISTFKAIKLAWSKPNVKIESYELDNHLSPIVEANAITLTPGTITIEKNEDSLVVLHLKQKDEVVDD